jgi:hypothetical protein
MGFRFRRSVKLLPGIRLNFSTRGISTSIGGRGATMNISRRGVRSTFGIPGTGLSYTTPLRRFSDPSGTDRAVTSAGSAVIGWIILIVALLMIGSCIARLSDSATTPPPAAPAPGPTFATRTVAGSSVNCRAEPKTGAVVTKHNRGDELVLLEQVGGWSKVAQNGGFCWVSDSLLR